MSLRLPKRNALPFIVAGTLAAEALIAVLAPRVLAVIQKSQGSASTNVGHTVRQPFANGNGLVAWYPLDGNAQDASGNGNDSTLQNFTNDGTTNGWVNSKFGKGLLFNGSSDSVTASITNAPLGAFTWSMWIKPTVGGQYTGVLNQNGANNSSFFNLVMYDQNIRFEIGASPLNLISSGNRISINAWNHVVATYDPALGSNQMKVYINGLLNAQSTNVATGSAGSMATFGNYQGYYFNGSLDDARIYNRALSQSEITQLYQGSQPVTCDQYCVGWWKLDESSGTTAKDTTSNGNTGTLTNFTFDGTTNGWTSGVFGNALQFSGSNDSISVPDSPALDPTAAITLVAWFKTSGLGGGIVGKRTWAGYLGYRLVFFRRDIIFYDIKWVSMLAGICCWV